MNAKKNLFKDIVSQFLKVNFKEKSVVGFFPLWKKLK